MSNYFRLMLDDEGMVLYKVEESDRALDFVEEIRRGKDV